jgi:hypothetical protein
MSIKNLLLAASMLLALGSVSAWAASHEKAEMECVPQAEFDVMSDEDKSKLTLSVCEGDEGDEKMEDAPAPATK